MWNPEHGYYGGPINATCPVTSSPTSDPTDIPTTITVAPTDMPTSAPTSISNMVSKITVTTDTKYPGIGMPLIAQLNWSNNLYKCIIHPTNLSSSYSCDPTNSTRIIPDAAIPYFIKLEYNSSLPIQISMINVTTDDGMHYAIDEFCIR